MMKRVVCKRCGGKIRWKGNYLPYCSFHCQEWAKTEAAYRYLDRLNAATESTDGWAGTPKLVATEPEG